MNNIIKKEIIIQYGDAEDSIYRDEKFRIFIELNREDFYQEDMINLLDNDSYSKEKWIELFFEYMDSESYEEAYGIAEWTEVDPEDENNIEKISNDYLPSWNDHVRMMSNRHNFDIYVNNF